MHPDPERKGGSKYECPGCGLRVEAEDIEACPECGRQVRDIGVTRE